MSDRNDDTANYDLLKLDNQLCFALYAATRAITRTYRDRLADIGLTYPQYLVLITLWEQDGLTISEIGKRLMLDNGTLTPLIKRLEAGQFVDRKRDENDERKVRVWVTDKGNGVKSSTLEARKFVACKLNMSEEEILALRGELMALIDQVSPASEYSFEADGAAV